jgi:Kef-type K+ transport system membrane component KefB
MNILRSKYATPVVAAIIIVSAAIVLQALNRRTELIFSQRESDAIRLFCDVVGFPYLPFLWAGLTGHPKSYAASVLLGVSLVVLLVVIWAAIIYFVRALFWRIRGSEK